MTPDALAALHARCFTTPAPWRAGDFAGFITDPLAFLLVEGDAGCLLGRAVAGEAELLTLAIAPEARRLGLGRKLVTRFLYQSRLRGAAQAVLEVSAANAAAIRLYESAGFSRTGLRRGYYLQPDGARIDALILSRPLSTGDGAGFI